jgi:ATP-binding cassette subfamily B protein
MRTFKHYKQRDMMDCGPTCLKMTAEYYGKICNLPELREACFIGKQGVSMLGIAHAAEKIGFATLSAKVPLSVLIAEKPEPFIVHWKQNHFVVVFRITDKHIYVADPASQILRYTHAEFAGAWAGEQEKNDKDIIVLFLEPDVSFTTESEGLEEKTDFLYYLSYLRPHRRLIVQLFLSLTAATVLSLFFPLLTQSLVDTGIHQKNLSFVYVVLIAQLIFFFAKTATAFIRSRILIHLSVRLNIRLSADYLAKLVRLPIPFFDSKNLGDILQRLQDNERIQHFLSSTALDFIFSLASLFSVSFLVILYSPTVFLVFMLFSAFYVLWITFFLKKRRELDNKKFALSSDTQSNEVELVQGMAEIKLNNFEQEKRWEWERLQVKRAKLAMSSLSLQQWQQYGSAFINELKNIIITFYAAYQVIEGNMTLGMMMAVQQVLGQMDAPMMHFVSFIQQGQDAKLSLERLNEIRTQKEEDLESMVQNVPEGKDIHFRNLTFRYGTPYDAPVLNNLNFSIPAGKTTAIVGESGSGKTTLLKLLLKYYAVESGEISIGATPLRLINAKVWRSKVGAVLQDGFIFSESIAKNIALGDENPNFERLLFAAQTANILSHIENLPLGFQTKIGQAGDGLSQGQKQRILIARAVYKDPDFLFFDEATSALDAKNEKIISENLAKFGKNKTQVVIAHRLSTVKNADQILFLQKGEIKEIGTHDELVAKKGLYFELVKNQLELAA